MDEFSWSKAVEAAQSDVNYLISCDFLCRDPEWIKAWYQFDLKFAGRKKRYLSIPKNEVMGFVTMARMDPRVFDLARYVAGTRLAAGRNLPIQLKDLMAEYLKGEFTPPKSNVGRKTNWGRDFIIINTMRRLLDEWGVTATRNLHKKSVQNSYPCASEILAEALRGTAIGYMEVNRIQRIWGSETKQLEHDNAYRLHLKSRLDDEPKLVRV